MRSSPLCWKSSTEIRGNLGFFDACSHVSTFVRLDFNSSVRVMGTFRLANRQEVEVWRTVGCWITVCGALFAFGYLGMVNKICQSIRLWCIGMWPVFPASYRAVFNFGQFCIPIFFCCIWINTILGLVILSKILFCGNWFFDREWRSTRTHLSVQTKTDARPEQGG